MSDPTTPLHDLCHHLCTAARAAGRNRLTEPEGLEVAAGLGFAVPRWRLVEPGVEVSAGELAEFPGKRVVVKVVAAEIAHKTEVGGVAVCPREAEAVNRALREMEGRLGGGVRFGIYEHVDHDPALGGELLVGVRWSRAFGPVVAVGPGGVHAERLAAAGLPAALLTPRLGSGEHLRRVLAGQPFTGFLSAPQRGAAVRVPLAELVELAGRLLELGRRAVPEPLAEFELNPVVVTQRGLVALDAAARLGERPAAAPPRPLHKIDRLLHPGSAAVVGVSSRGVNPGRRILRNLLQAGFDHSRLWVVKPGAGEVDGCPCVDGLEALPGPVDLLVLAVAAAQVPALVEAAIDGRRAESLVLIPGGLGETEGSGERARAVTRRLRASRDTEWGGPVVNGGNCLGVRSVGRTGVERAEGGGCNTLFIPPEKLSFPDGPPAPVALLSQSGAFAIARASQLARLNPRHLVTTGNQLDLTVTDYLVHLADDPAVRVFGCYVEGFPPGDGERFLEAAARVRADGRAVVLYHAGRTPEGSAAVASHTASVAGDDRVTRELARQAGVLVADGLEDFDDLVRLCWRLDGRPAAGPRLAALSNAGFECVALADHLGGLELPPFAAATREALEVLLRQHRLAGVVDVHNPLDLTPILGDAGFAAAAEAVLADEATDLAVVGCVPLTEALGTLDGEETGTEDRVIAGPGAVGPRLVELWRCIAKPWVAVVDSGPLYDPLVELLEAGGVPVFRRADRAVRMLAAWSGCSTAGPANLA